MSARGNKGTIISSAIAVGLVFVSAFSLIAFLALSAYAPDLRNESNGDAHVLSKSAIGFAGLRVLLEADRIASIVDRGLGSQGERQPGLIVLTPEITSASSDIKDLCKLDACLIILPKWIPIEDPSRDGYAMRVAPFDKAAIAALLKDISKGTNVRQGQGITSVQLEVRSAFPRYQPPKHDLKIDTVQTIDGPR